MPQGIRKPFTKEHRKNMGLAKIGKSMPIEVRKKISKNHIGLKASEETKKKLSIMRMGNAKPQNAYKFPKGKNHPCWKGGIALRQYPSKWTETLKESIKQRDGYVCRLCRGSKSLVIHHIDYKKENCNPDNLITLCRKCHPKTNFNIDYWIKLFFPMTINQKNVRDF